jgi:phosphomannomutase
MCSSICASTDLTFGGEQSGHIIMSDFTTTGDGFVAALQVLAVVQKQSQPVSKVCHRFDPLAAGPQERALQERQAA